MNFHLRTMTLPGSNNKQAKNVRFFPLWLTEYGP